jgi:sulfonate transport system substrate-binding protein
MQRRQVLQLMAAMPALAMAQKSDTELVVAANRATIESAPLFIQSIPGIRVVPVTNGRVALAQLVAGTVDATTGNETQALLNSLARPELRIVLTLAECRYRMVARRSAGIQSIADLRGKRVAYTPGTSAQYFLIDMLRSANLTLSDITPVSLEGPAMPASIASKQIDAMAMWEPDPQKAMLLLGADGIVLTNTNGYLERFNLNTTTAVLNDPKRRAVLVNAVRAIAEMSRKLSTAPTPFLPKLAESINTPVDVINAVWPQFRFPATLESKPLLSTLTTFEPWAARIEKREPRPAEVLARMIDTSVAREAGLLGKRADS